MMMIQCRATLHRPAESPRKQSWSFLILPRDASAQLPTRSMTTVEGTLNGHPFQATLEPDGQKSHWLKVSRKLRESANANVGEMVTLEIRPVDREPEPRIPTDFRAALKGAPEASNLWSRLTPIARRDWIHWIVSAKKAETRQKRIDIACDMLAKGKRRVCCFDRSGFYSKSMAPPEPAE
ncbi:MAG: DUF1905 domain-containing protein [Kiritimatiellae bacterium]|nr:DUF1905 domain-containing protein [Kiritimatiellia bacterium]